MRAYFFGNMYLSSIQQGIQAAHATHEMFTKYRNQITPEKVLYDWAIDHKTMILLNGGYAETIQELVFFFERQPGHLQCDYPFAPFYEEKASLNGALTTVGIILPKKSTLSRQQFVVNEHLRGFKVKKELLDLKHFVSRFGILVNLKLGLEIQ